MPTSTQPIFTLNHYYHIYNRGIAKQVIFHETRDFQRFIDALAFYVEAKPSNKFSASEWEYIKNIRDEPVKEALVEVVSFCLMPNHFHILAKQALDYPPSLDKWIGITSGLEYCRQFSRPDSCLETTVQHDGEVC